MTTPTPTGSPSGYPTGQEGVGGLSPSTPAFPPTSTQRAFLPLPLGEDRGEGSDALDLQRVASAMFRALPGADAVYSATGHGAPALPAASSAPHSAPRESAVTSGIPSVPANYAPALPSLEAAAIPSSASYYFLDFPGAASDIPGAASPRFSFLDGNEAARDPRVIGVPLGGYPAAGLFDVQAIRRDFPILAERVNGKPLIWFDNAATTQKPRAVIDRISYFYAHENSNIHRAAHELAARSTDAYEAARRKVADFLGAKGPEEIIFVRGATEAINLVAKTFGRQEIDEGDEIILSLLEHHANIVPWQQLADFKKAKIRVIPVDDSGQIILSEYARLLNPRTKLVAVTQVSNALGTVTPITEIIALAHAAGAKVLVDGAQAVSHMRVNVQAMDADFYVFSGHKVFGPTGIGAVYGKKEWLDRLPPWQGGGNMIADVTFENTVFQPAPARFEAGTGNIADAVGLGAAIDYVRQIGLERIHQYEHQLLEYATARLGIIPGVRLIGTAREKAGVLSFVLDGYKTEEVGHALNREGVAVRSGHHCAQPILRRFGVEATVRPSLAFYNTCEEVDTFIKAIRGLSARR